MYPTKRSVYNFGLLGGAVSPSVPVIRYLPTTFAHSKLGSSSAEIKIRIERAFPGVLLINSFLSRVGDNLQCWQPQRKCHHRVSGSVYGPTCMEKASTLEEATNYFTDFIDNGNNYGHGGAIFLLVDFKDSSMAKIQVRSEKVKVTYEKELKQGVTYIATTNHFDEDFRDDRSTTTNLPFSGLIGSWKFCRYMIPTTLKPAGQSSVTMETVSLIITPFPEMVRAPARY